MERRLGRHRSRGNSGSSEQRSYGNGRPHGGAKDNREDIFDEMATAREWA